jgi:hypothetical protein
MTAAVGSFTAVAEVLVQAGADLNHRDPVSYAKRACGASEISVTYACIVVFLKDGRTALMIATLNNDTAMARVLLLAGTDPNPREVLTAACTSLSTVLTRHALAYRTNLQH